MGFYTTDERAAVLEPCQENPVPPSKNRVWDFFTTSETCAGFFESQPVEPHQEKWPTPTTTVSGVRYYGYRQYSPEMGRWLSRDPIDEKGGISLYAFCNNKGVDKCDKLGKMPIGNVPQFTFSMDETFYLADSCGHFVWDMLLNVGGPSPLDGYVIQETKIEAAFTDCNGNPLNGPNAHYWEAWYFNDFVANDQPVDGWQFSIPGGVTCSKGWILFTGTAAYYAGFDASSWPHDPNSPSGGDPGTVTQDPLLPSPSSSSVHRSLLATWNCCSGTANTQVTKSIY